jgi:hypothetical protein
MEREMIEVIQKILSENAERQLNLGSVTCQWILARQIADALAKVQNEGDI